MMASLTNTNFDIPAGYTVEKIDGQLYLEDIDEDDELYLIRMPCDIELSALDKKKIILSENFGDVCIKNIKTEDGQLLECFAETRDIPSTCVVLPKKSDGQLHAVKKTVKGSILISIGLELDNNVEIKSEVSEEVQESLENSTRENVKVKSEGETEVEQQNNIESASQEHKKKKKHSSEFETSDLNYEFEEVENLLPPHKFKEKSPKKHSKSSDNTAVNSQSEYFPESTLNSSLETKKKSKKKKRQSVSDFDVSTGNNVIDNSESLLDSSSQKLPKKHLDKHRKLSSDQPKIKTEIKSMDLDDFPNCDSQK